MKKRSRLRCDESNVCSAPGQVNDGLTLQPTAGERLPSIHQQGQQTTNHTTGWRETKKNLPALLQDIHAHTHTHTGRRVQTHAEETTCARGKWNLRLSPEMNSCGFTTPASALQQTKRRFSSRLSLCFPCHIPRQRQCAPWSSMPDLTRSRTPTVRLQSRE